MADLPHVVIIGAGFSGLGALRELEHADVRVTLIDRNAFHTFLPLLYQVATNQLTDEQVGFPSHEMVNGKKAAEFVQATINGIDPSTRQVHLEGKPSISYDYLVFGLGAVVNFFGTPGAVEHAFPLYTMQDALRLKAHIADRLTTAGADESQLAEGALRFVVVGGGATGVEIAGAISELLAAELEKEHRAIPSSAAEVHVYEMAPQLLTPFKPKLRDYAKNALEKRNVSVHLGEGVAGVEPGVVHLKSGDSVKAQTLVWAAGLTANPLVHELGQPLVKGRVATQPDLSLPDHPEIFVVGDSALNTDSKTGNQLPQLGSVALQAGTCAGENISRLVKGKKTEPFEYKDKGTMAMIGRGAAIVEFNSGRTMTGRAAWLAWLGVHLMLLSGGGQKAHTFVDWGWDVLSRGEGSDLDDEDVAA
jgi:NADH dehydrogenase